MGCTSANPDTVVKDALAKCHRQTDIENDLTANEMVAAVFEKFDTNKSGYLERDQQDAIAIQVWEYLECSDTIGLTMVVARGGDEEKLKFAREHLDVSRDAKISRDELREAFVAMLEHTKQAKLSGEWSRRENVIAKRNSVREKT